MKIIIEKRSDDYMAYLEGSKGIWDCGPTPSMAIGKLMITHKEVFGLEMEMRKNEMPQMPFPRNPKNQDHRGKGC